MDEAIEVISESLDKDLMDHSGFQVLSCPRVILIDF